MVGIEGVGDAVAGSLIARAVEPGAGEAQVGAEGSGFCLNCGAELVGPYCHSCGQQGHVHRTLTAFWHDLAHGVLHFEGKIWHTLPLLAWRPGELTRRYVRGERARFVSPMALFLFSVFLMFAVINTVGGPVGVNSRNEANAAARENGADRARLVKQLADLEGKRAQAVSEKRSTRPLDVSIASTRQGLAVINSIEGKPVTADGGAFMEIETSASMGWFNSAYRKAKENPSLLLYKVQTNAYKFSWALIPLSVPFVWLLFLWRRNYRVYDHTVFVTYSLSFMTMLVVALSLIRAIGLGGGWSALVLTIVPPVHMYRQLRGAYELSRFSALWRTAFLILFSLIAITLFLLMLVAIGVLD